MKQLVIISGKGGTGKTVISACFAALAQNKVMADCDVDAANLYLLLHPEIQETHQFTGGMKARIEQENCIACGLCADTCRFSAIDESDVGELIIDPISCEGCGVCEFVCPNDAIIMVERVCGHAYISNTRFGPMSHARLDPGMENSGKLVSLVRRNAKKLAENGGQDLILVDGPPGIGCPAIASLAEIDYGLLVIEPTLSGIHDLKRALLLLEHFSVEPLVCINKYDLNENNTEIIQDFCKENTIDVVGVIPFDLRVTKAIVAGKPVVEFDSGCPASEKIHEMWNEINSIFQDREI